MEQAEKKMNGNSSHEKETLRKYLLGVLSDREAMRKIEENLLLDDDFEERLSIAEDELLEEYLDGSLSETERRHFLQFFLVTPERKERLRFIRDLRKYAVSNSGVKTDLAADAQRGVEASGEKKPFFNWRDLFASPAVRFAVVALIICGLGFAAWRLVFYQSYVDKGLAQLRVAYRGQRPVEPRTTVNLEYAPFSDTRSANRDGAVADARARDRAFSFLRDATENESDAEAFHAYGLFFLSEKEFDKALDEFNRALSLAPRNARLHSDIGAAYLEKAGYLSGDEQQSQFSRNIDSSLEHLNRALELDENLPEALFNKALALEKIPAPEQARQAWRKYLEKDSTSDWAKEAQRRLQALESQKSQSLSAEQLEKAFLEAFRRGDAAGAGQLISRNRELITVKYLPQALAVSFVKAPGNERDEYLRALIYAAELEEKNIDDSAAGNLASFYAKISEPNLELVKQAQALLLNSYKLCLDNETEKALAEAGRARQLFLQAGDDYEAALSQFIIVYCLVQNEDYRESLAAAQNLANFCRQNNYKWLLSHTLYWLAAAQRLTGDSAKAKLSYKDCLNLARETRDPQILQKILISFANRSKFVGENQVSLEYLQQAFNALASARAVSAREKWRSYSDSIEILSSLGLYNMAEAVSLENFQIAKDSERPVLIAFSQLDNGIVNAQAEDYEEARFWLNEVRQNAETKSGSGSRTELLAKSLLTLGYVERRLGNYAQAAKFYDEALATVENTQ
ncbi:MAG: tetratricopeptide repeat protein, partial [Acidobacteriota bacterium]|nr:tetratricopeptide repeat protein [Acidobacteriota bacterium]